MKLSRSIVVLAVAASLLVGCSSFKKLTGQTDNTVLPGEREDILPPDQQVNPRPNQNADGADAGGATADNAAPLEPSACDPAVDINCETPVDQEASGAQ